MDLAFAHDKYQLIVPILSSLVKESPLKESKVVLANLLSIRSFVDDLF